VTISTPTTAAQIEGLGLAALKLNIDINLYDVIDDIVALHDTFTIPVMPLSVPSPNPDDGSNGANGPQLSSQDSLEASESGDDKTEG
jgi:hypothetical protein